MPWYNDWMAFGPWWIFPFVMPLMMIVGLVVMLIVFRSVFGGRGPWWMDRPTPPESDRALDILRERLATGEITEQEYEQKRQLLAH
jgi:putative membrane protein